MERQPPKVTWGQRVTVAADVLEMRLDVARSRGLRPDGEAVATGVADLLKRARDAAVTDDRVFTRWWHWWRGTLVEGAYRNLHAARAQIVELYDEPELAAETPGALARASAILRTGDPRSISATDLQALPLQYRRARLRRLLEEGYEATDQQHAQLRSLRNVVLMSAVLTLLLAAATTWVVSQYPTVMPLCFPVEPGTGGSGATGALNCPTKSLARAPAGGDVLIVALLGLLGGALAAVVSLRNLDGTVTAYDVPLALGMLKMPIGALTAIVGLVAIQGDFLPGLSAFDSQGQILAYAFVFGFAQQVFMRLLDRRAEALLDGLPGRGGPAAPAPPMPPPVAEATEATGGLAVPAGGAVVLDAAEFEEEVDDEPEEPQVLPNPEGDDDDQVQDDEQVDLLPDAPEPDDR